MQVLSTLLLNALLKRNIIRGKKGGKGIKLAISTKNEKGN